eukprot:CAMPEP_0115842246 /NCGR_PEP_ID=MMETSP0287-20121206/7701_1 /TAXON_ID=412157 /ORGANISM="Chrysochromulina rotalis, Strain UIO044" /LENGTH=39 /DNA_ID= /DNA_START= /DNA_END= /DNA_ORIENTATION=
MARLGSMRQGVDMEKFATRGCARIAGRRGPSRGEGGAPA